ncbi:Gamma Purothionin (chloroplast) [Artemisia annua]|uniref:Gamma Purothionin n=1 Tax=Artemisia annua TaxID=35608 RepID=A0A2U1PB51_ARTAN|nr:Gamma Purothionin [Artemisia annua]
MNVMNAEEMIPGAEGRMCISKSHKYHGACWHDHNCAIVCRDEGFSGVFWLEQALKCSSLVVLGHAWLKLRNNIL